ncbi:MAG: hypothetical protein IKC74_01705 [Clostridia bacterium]|nr:hypothetical protein [Clostridia bacterium]
MKKLFSILLVLLMLCSVVIMSACSDPDDNDDNTDDPSNSQSQNAQKLIEDSIKKINDLDSYYAIMTQDIHLSMQGVSMDMPVTVSIKVQDATTANPKMYAIQDMQMLGQNITTELYIDGDYIYLDSNGYQAKISKNEIGDTDQLSYDKTLEELLLVLPDDVMNDIIVKINESGNRYVEVDFDSAKFLEFYESNIEDISSSINASIDDLQISDSKVKIVLDKSGYVKEYVLTYKMSISTQGQTANADVNLKIEFIDPGKSVTVTPMEGYQNFPLIDY